MEIILKFYLDLIHKLGSLTIAGIKLDWLEYLILTIMPSIAVVAIAMLTALIVIWWERREIAFFQVRLGPNRLGPFGLFQTTADAIKILLKEDIIPANVDKTIYTLAPMLIFIPGMIVWGVIPFSPGWYVADLDVSLLFLYAFSGLTTVAIIMMGWASNNKYSLLGGIRGVAQSISYEVPMLLSTVGVVILAGSLSLVEIVNSQNIWGFITQPLGFIIYFICAIAEVNRIPFDLPECESELVSGHITEYSGFKFALPFLAEYVNTFTISLVASILFFGGWRFPFDNMLNVINIDFLGMGLGTFLSSQLGIIWLFIKAYFFFSVIVWFRATFPRLRPDQLMAFSWKFLLPLALINIFITGIFAACGFGMFIK